MKALEYTKDRRVSIRIDASPSATDTECPLACSFCTPKVAVILDTSRHSQSGFETVATEVRGRHAPRYGIYYDLSFSRANRRRRLVVAFISREAEVHDHGWRAGMGAGETEHGFDQFSNPPCSCFDEITELRIFDARR